MAEAHFFAESPEQVGLDRAKIDKLFERAEREIDQGLLPSCQLAIARKGRIGAMKTLGRVRHGQRQEPATNQTLYIIFSSTKAIISSAIWLLMQEGKLSPQQPVAEIVPEFAANGKAAITVEQVMLHISGFPNAPYPHNKWSDRAERVRRLASWRLEWQPGSRYTYHPTSGFWVLGEIIERLSGQDFRQFVAERIAAPLGLPRLRVGLPRAEQGPVADIIYTSTALTAEDYLRLGLPVPPETEVTEEAILGFNDPGVREAGVPGGGGIMTAADLALFYQALIGDGRAYDGTQVWQPATLREALRVRSGDHVDPVFGHKVNRALGVVIAGDDGYANYRGFGKTNSAVAFGHGGAGGQIGWGDPASGISFAYCTNGFDRNDVRMGRRGVALSSLAAVCALD